MDRFTTSVQFVFDAEGFYSNDPADRGGATKFGISLRFLKGLPKSAGDLDRDGDVDIDDIRFVTLDQARSIYRDQFWNECRCGDLPPGLDTVMLCTAVNHGPGYAKKLLQESLRVAVDGQIGDKTLAAARGARLAELIPEMLSRRALFYADIVRSNSTQARFERGWYRRLFCLQQFVLG